MDGTGRDERRQGLSGCDAANYGEWRREPVTIHFEIRLAEPNDAASIAQVLLESFLEFKPLYTERGFAATTSSAEQILVRMQQGPVWLALRERAPIGTVAAVLEPPSVYLRGMAVVPSARGSGTGAALLQRVEDWSIGKGCTRLFLSTTPFLHSAIRLYERAGFKRPDAAPGDLFGTPLFIMEKNIQP